MADIPVQVTITADTDQAIAGIKKVDSAVDAFSKDAKGASRGADTLSNSMGGMSASALLASNRSRMLTQQLSQVAQQSVATGQVVQAFAVQAADIGLAFGTVGTIVGALAGVALPTLVAALSDSSAEAEDWCDVMDRARQSLDDYSEVVRLADITTGELGERFLQITPGVTAFANAIKGVADRESLANMEQAIALVTTLGREAGEAAETFAGNLGDLAEVFSLNVGLAFGKEALAARDAAREMVQEYEATQIALENANGDLSEQSRLLRSLLDLTIALANVNGEITEAENERIAIVARALELVERRRDTIEREALAAQQFAAAMEGVATAAQGSLTVIKSLESPMRNAANAAADFFTNLFNASKLQAGIIAQANQRRGGGRGGDPRQFGMDATGRILASMGGEFIDFGTAGGRGGGRGGGGGGRDSARITSLIESLQTEREVLEEWRMEGMELLAQANAAELEAIGGQNEAKLRLQEEYMERLQQLQRSERDATLGSYETMFGNLATVFAQGGEKALKISKAFALAEAGVSIARGAAKALELPFPANLAAWSTVLATGAQAIASIKSASPGNAGSLAGGGGGATPAAAATPQQPGQNIVIDFQGDTFSRQGGIALIEQINEAIRDGGRIEGIMAR